MPVVEKKFGVTNNVVDVYVYTWSIRNYTITGKRGSNYATYISKSPKFILNNQEWEIKLCLSEESTEVGIVVERIRFVPAADGERINGKRTREKPDFASISILNDSNEKFETTFLNFDTAVSECLAWRIDNFTDRGVLENKSNRLLKNDTLNFMFELTRVRSKNNIYDNSKVESTMLQNDDHAYQKRRNDTEKMYLESRYSDVKLVTLDGRELPAHKIVLSSVPFFDNMFRHEVKESWTSVIEIKDVEHDVLKEMLRFIYTGKVEEVGLRARELLIVADKYSMDDLKMECSKYLNDMMSTENVFHILELADKHNVAELKSRTLEFIKENIEAITRSDANFMSWLRVAVDNQLKPF